MKKILSAIVLVFIFVNTKAQNNGLYVIDLINRTVDSLNPVTPSELTSLITPFNKGTYNNVTLSLPLSWPSGVLCDPASGFTLRKKIQEIGNITSYPARTYVKTGGYNNGGLNLSLGSGTMVGNKYVLTDHWHINFFFPFGFPPIIPSNIRTDSFYVFAAYQNGTTPPGINPVRVKKIYYFKKDALNLTYNICLLELEQPLGNVTGWQSIGYNNDDSFFAQGNLHKFSTPRSNGNPLQSLAYNGDTVYHSYGRIDVTDRDGFDGGAGVLYKGPLIGFNNLSFNCATYFGEQGSSFFATNNVDSFITYGVAGPIVNLFLHARITPEVFAAFEPIITNITTSANNITSSSLVIYPNPAASELFIKSTNLASRYELRIINTNGQVLKQFQNFSQGMISLSGLQPGIYLVQLRNKKELLTQKIVKH